MNNGLTPTGTSSLSDTMDVTLVGDDTVPTRAESFDLNHDVQGQRLGRYVVLDRLGSGAMGVVLAAYDPELDRKVAIKLLHPREHHSGEQEPQLRLQAEAQALARLSDPHVVVVHDVGTHEGRVFVAMEFVEGQTLRSWSDAAPRRWTEILDVLVDAGRGLAAAHARELIHRDFKPDNVMLGDDGRVRVMDFGLARADDEPGTRDGDRDNDSKSGSALDSSDQRQSVLSLELTHPGSLMGTPAYMAPECFEGQRGGALADQFAFCVTLWESLYGQSPFPADTLPTLYNRVLLGDIAEPPAGHGVPRWLRRAMERGLAVEPEQRWASMEALLHALGRGRGRARRRVAAAVAVCAVGALGVALGVAKHDESQRRHACETEGQRIAEVWNDRAAASVLATMEQVDPDRARLTMDKTRPWLDDHAAVWSEAREESCIRARVDQTWDPEIYERAQWCLDERLEELRAVVDELGEDGQRAMIAAVPVSSGLLPVSPCLDTAVLARLPAPPLDGRDQLGLLRAELMRIRTLETFGAEDEALDSAEQVLERTQALGWAPLTATAMRYVGAMQLKNAHYEEAEKTLEDAYFMAVRTEMLFDGISAANDLQWMLGHEQSRHTDALRWGRHAELLLEQLPSPNEGLRLSVRMNTSAVYYSMGDFERAVSIAEEVVEQREAALGSDHPRVASAIANLGLFKQGTGDYSTATQLYQRANTLYIQLYGPDHPTVADTKTNLGAIALRSHDLDRAAVLIGEAARIREASYGPDHPQTAHALNNYGSVLVEQGEVEPARDTLRRALDIYVRTLGVDNPATASCRYNYAETLRHLQQVDEAREQHEEALRVNEAALGPDHPRLAFPVQALALMAIAQERFDEAVALAERAVQLRAEGKAGAGLRAESRFVLARARWGQGRDRAQALRDAEWAVEQYRSLDGGRAGLIAEIEAWQAERKDEASAGD